MTKYFLTDSFFGTDDVEIPGWFYYALIGSLLFMALIALLFTVACLLIVMGML